MKIMERLEFQDNIQLKSNLHFNVYILYVMSITDCHPKKTCVSYAHYTVSGYYLKFVLPLNTITCVITPKFRKHYMYTEITFCTK